MYAFGGNPFRHVDRLGARLRLVAATCLECNGRELRFGPEPLRRQHRLGEIEAEIFVGLVVIGARDTARCEHEGDGNSKMNALQDHGRLLKLIIKRVIYPYLGGVAPNSSRQLPPWLRSLAVSGDLSRRTRTVPETANGISSATACGARPAGTGGLRAQCPRA